MPNPQDIRGKTFDAIVVGSGATGGWAAKELTESGLRVLVLEAGRELNPVQDFTEHKQPWEMPWRGRGDRRALERDQPVQSRCYACTEYSHQFFVNDRENPYTTPPGKPFSWIRSRHVGGRSLVWARQSYRLSDYDFKAAGRDGFGEDWPISYAELAPYYDKVESFIGVSGSLEGLPQLPDGKFLPPMPLTCGELEMKKAAEKLGRRLFIGRSAILTRNHNGRAACHYCGTCERGCFTGSYFSSPAVTLPAAAKTGRMTLQPRAIARQVLKGPDGKARGVLVVDQATRETYEVFSRAVVLCASTLESTRLLMLSGLGQTSGALGHYLMDHIFNVRVAGIFRNTPGPPAEWEGTRANGIYIPRWHNLDSRTHKNFLRGYGYQGGAQRSHFPVHAYDLPGLGRAFKLEVRKNWPTPVWLAGFGEMLPRYENYVELNPRVTDAWGIPVLNIVCAHGENEKAIAQEIVVTAMEILHEAGVEITSVNFQAAEPGLGIHETGTARMGSDPKKSVLNAYNQVHDAPNVLVTDGACYVSQGTQNPTLTLMALTVRACEHLLQEMKKSNV